MNRLLVLFLLFPICSLALPCKDFSLPPGFISDRENGEWYYYRKSNGQEDGFIKEVAPLTKNKDAIFKTFASVSTKSWEINVESSHMILYFQDLKPLSKIGLTYFIFHSSINGMFAANMNREDLKHLLSSCEINLDREVDALFDKYETYLSTASPL